MAGHFSAVRDTCYNEQADRCQNFRDCARFRSSDNRWQQLSSATNTERSSSSYGVCNGIEFRTDKLENTRIINSYEHQTV